MLSANGGRFKINQLLFVDGTALVVDSEEQLCILVSEFGRVCERRKLRVNVYKSKVVGPNGEPLEEVDCFKWSRKRQLMEDAKGMLYTERQRGIERG